MLRLVILALSLLAGGTAAWVSMSLSGAVSVPPGSLATTPSVSGMEVLVAAIDIMPGTMLESENLRWQQWPQEALSDAFITRNLRPDAVQVLSGMIVSNGFFAGEPVMEGRLSSGDTGTLAVMLTSGKRAIAVRISAENTAGGLVLPNDRVDVLHTTSRQSSTGAIEISSLIILKNIRVLAVDQVIDGASGPIVGKTATLELEAKEVERVTAAEASGTISLALRSIADSGELTAQIAVTKTVRVNRGGLIEIVELK